MSGVRYRVTIADPHTHLVKVEVRVVGVEGPVELVMASWTPGSYLIREFARHVQDFRAEDGSGAPLAWRKTDKNTWRIEGSGAGGVVRAEYTVYANELTVRTSHVDASHAYLNGASVFMAVRGRESDPLDLEVVAPAGWEIATELPGGESEAAFRAGSFDELVDSPLEIGTHRVLAWEQDGLPHRYVIWGRGDYDANRIVSDTRSVIETTRELFGGPLPYRGYTFILHLVPEGRGGLEHASSSSLQVAGSGLRGDGYESFIALVAHEFFHVWNAKRIRPEPLGPFDYTRENYTRNLWVVEGFTTYYTDLVLRRAGLMTPARYLQRLTEAIGRLQTLPGRAHQSLEDASFDAWIKFYRPDEHTPNSQISYYHKGALVALLLDMEIRRATGGARSLDDLLRLLWTRYGAEDVGFPEDPRAGIQALAEEIAGAPLGGFFDHYVRGTAELDYDAHLDVVGLRLVRGPADGEEGGGAARTPPSEAAVLASRLGVRTQERDGNVAVTHVLAGSPAHAAGVNARDEIVAIDGARAGAVGLAALLEPVDEGQEATLTLARRGELLEVGVRVGPRDPPEWRLVDVPGLTEAQRAERARWLGAAPAR